MDNEKNNRTELNVRTRTVATDDGPAVQTWTTAGAHGIAGETQRIWINLN